MRSLGTALAFATLSAASALTLTASTANALTAQECSAKYKTAKEANTLGGKTWNDFRKSECGDGAAPAAATAAPAKQAATTQAVGKVMFPKVISSKFATEKPAKARLHTCAEQYKANKAANANGGLRWIQKGGGYWSECNKVLKGKA